MYYWSNAELLSIRDFFKNIKNYWTSFFFTAHIYTEQPNQRNINKKCDN